MRAYGAQRQVLALHTACPLLRRTLLRAVSNKNAGTERHPASVPYLVARAARRAPRPPRSPVRHRISDRDIRPRGSHKNAWCFIFQASPVTNNPLTAPTRADLLCDWVHSPSRRTGLPQGRDSLSFTVCDGSVCGARHRGAGHASGTRNRHDGATRGRVHTHQTPAPGAPGSVTAPATSPPCGSAPSGRTLHRTACV